MDFTKCTNTCAIPYMGVKVGQIHKTNDCFWKFMYMQIYRSHVLVHFANSIGAYNVESSSTLFSDNIQWSFEIPFPCARFKSLVGYNLITKRSNHQKWDVQAPISWNWKNTLSCEIYFFENIDKGTYWI